MDSSNYIKVRKDFLNAVFKENSALRETIRTLQSLLQSEKDIHQLYQDSYIETVMGYSVIDASPDKYLQKEALNLIPPESDNQKSNSTHQIPSILKDNEEGILPHQESEKESKIDYSDVYGSNEDVPVKDEETALENKKSAPLDPLINLPMHNQNDFNNDDIDFRYSLESDGVPKQVKYLMEICKVPPLAAWLIYKNISLREFYQAMNLNPLTAESFLSSKNFSQNDFKKIFDLGIPIDIFKKTLIAEAKK